MTPGLRFLRFAPSHELEQYTGHFAVEWPHRATEKRRTFFVRFCLDDWMDYAHGAGPTEPRTLAAWIIKGPGVEAYRRRFGV